MLATKQSKTTKAKTTLTRPDADIARDIHQHMKEDIMVPDDQVRARVVNGVVTLSGTVAHAEQKRSTENCVREVKGVHDVRNQIVVDPSTAVNLGA
jgi:osmotically-inducible protein OsmY